jgi:hypothetical protein
MGDLRCVIDQDGHRAEGLLRELDQFVHLAGDADIRR